MEKIILVHYIDTTGMSDILLKENFKRYGEVLGDNNNNGLLINFVLPTTKGGHRIECINPKLITGDEYNDVLKVFEKAKKDLNEFFLNK
jgi:hypothetical protein